MRDASNSERPCRASSRDEKSRATVNDGIPVPRWCACEQVGDVPAAISSPVALCAVADWPKAIGRVRLRPLQPCRSWVLPAVGPGASGLKRSTGLEPTWSSGDRSPQEMKRNYA